MLQARKRGFHRQQTLRLHSSGKWIRTIGRAWSDKNSKLTDKDWYVGGTEVDGTKEANAKARQWELRCANWDKIERASLEILGEPPPLRPRIRSQGEKWQARRLQHCSG